LRHVPDGLVEDTLKVALCKSRALHVLDCLDLLGHADSLLILDGCHLLLSQTFLGVLVVAKIELGSDQDNGNTWCVVLNLGVPLFVLSDTVLLQGFCLLLHSVPLPLRCRKKEG
jgi:hypothetical protein